ncbi:hypothetical protein BJV74DRAFT_479594 [Russula compacta]|nr:hypothetical protein BJV74DRAFT_479594 [Russula compacta]
MGTGFDFGDSEDFGFGDIGDELAKELGEGWASAPVQPKPSAGTEQQFPIHFDQADMNIDSYLDGDFALDGPTQPPPTSPVSGKVLTSRQSPTKKRNFDVMAADIMPQSPGLPPHIIRTPTPPWATGTEVAAPRNTAAAAATEGSASSGEAPLVPRKTKRVRVRFDTRIELTDEELKAARSQYVEDQEARRERLKRGGSRNKALTLSLKCSMTCRPS